MPKNLYEEIEELYHPRSMAAVGVSERMENQGMGFLIGYKKLGFQGGLYAINPTKKFDKFDTYPSVKDVPGPLDKVKICVPAKAVPQVMRDCVEKGVKTATIFSSGFRESGTEEGAALEEEVLAIAKEGGIRVIGPNCMGLYCPESGMSIRGDMPAVEGGNISLIAQSGGVAISFIMMAAEKGLGVAKAVSYGNESDLGPPEFLHYMARDPATKVICLYIEGTRRPEELKDALADAASKKPVVVLKGGSTDVGNRAVASHTGALTGQAEVWDAFIRQCGAMPVSDIKEMLDGAVLYSLSAPPPGDRVGLLTVSGGFGVFATDQVIKAGFRMPRFSDEVTARIKEFINAPGTSVANPADMAAKFFQPQHYEKMFRAFDDENNFDCYVMIMAMEYLAFLGSREREVSTFLVKAIKGGLDLMKKPVYIVFYQTAADQVRLDHVRYLLNEGYPVFDDMASALRVLKKSMVTLP